MAEYIEREAVEEMLENAQLISNGEFCGYCTEDVSITEIPTADVAPVVHGRWKSYGRSLGECSNCGEIVAARHNYCPNCGADMRVYEEEKLESHSKEDGDT